MTERATKYETRAKVYVNGKAKIPLRRVASDSCAIWQGRTIKDGAVDNPGTPYYIHKGEWVEVVPIVSVEEMLALMRLQELGLGQGAQMEQALMSLCKELSRRIVRWNWTDIMGEAMGQPWDHPEVLARLTTDELFWLLTESLTSESMGERKNA